MIKIIADWNIRSCTRVSVQQLLIATNFVPFFAWPKQDSVWYHCTKALLLLVVKGGCLRLDLNDGRAGDNSLGVEGALNVLVGDEDV